MLQTEIKAVGGRRLAERRGVSLRNSLAQNDPACLLRRIMTESCEAAGTQLAFDERTQIPTLQPWDTQVPVADNRSREQ